MGSFRGGPGEGPEGTLELEGREKIRFVGPNEGSVYMV